MKTDISQFVMGNLWALIGSLALVVSMFCKTKKNMMKWQLLDCIVHVLSNMYLGGISGAIANIVAATRSLVCCLGIKIRGLNYLLIIIIVGLGIYFNNNGYIGYIPIIACVEYTLVVCNINSKLYTIKIGLLINLFLWLIYDTYLLSIPAIVTDIVCICSNLFALYIEYKNNLNNISDNGLTKYQRKHIKKKIINLKNATISNIKEN